MGLDIFLYKVNTPHLPSVIKKEKLQAYNHLTFIGADKEICRTFKENSKDVLIEVLTVDIDKLRSVYDIDDKIKDEDIYVVKAANAYEVQANNGVTHSLLFCLSEEEYYNVSFVERLPYMAAELVEVAYQRGISEDGWNFLPENCEFVDDKAKIEELTHHGLNKEFIEKWVDDKTIFEAWW